MKKLECLVMVALLAGLLVGCGGPAPEGEQAAGTTAPVDDAWQQVDESSLSPEQQAQLERGRAAQKALAEQLMGRLMEAMDAGGPPAAIEVCADEALRISFEQAAASGIQLGRTSFKLRNPLNEPPHWAAPVMAAGTAEPAILVGPGGQLGGMSPIVLKPECEVCHGPVEKIDAELLATIQDRYPEDQATGFEAGDLRGWFWFEVPAAG